MSVSVNVYKFQSVTAVPYRRCDSRNMGVSKLCSLTDAALPKPQIFGFSIEVSNLCTVPTLSIRHFRTKLLKKVFNFSRKNALPKT